MHTDRQYRPRVEASHSLRCALCLKRHMTTGPSVEGEQSDRVCDGVDAAASLKSDSLPGVRK